jgi:hypothetical protein
MPTIMLPQELAKVAPALQGKGAAPRALRAAIRRGQHFRPRLPLALHELASALGTTLAPSQLVRVVPMWFSNLAPALAHPRGTGDDSNCRRPGALVEARLHLHRSFASRLRRCR